MKKLINSVDGAVTRRASVTAPADRAAAHSARTVDDVDRPEITRSWAAPVDTPALRWER